MFKKEKKYIGISFSDQCLKIANLKITSTGKSVIGVVKKDVHGIAPEELPKITRALLSELAVAKPSAICALPASLVTTKNIEVPSIDPAEIKSIIDLQAGRHTPYSREEILIGYITIGVFQRNYTKVLLFIVNREQILKQLGFMTQAGIRIEKVVFAPEALVAFYAQALKINDENKPLGIIDISHDTTDFIIGCNKTIVTSRSIPVGMDQLIKEGAAAEEKLLAELMQSVEVYQGEDLGPLPAQYVLTCDDGKLQQLQPRLQEKLKANINITPYLDYVSASQPVMLRLVSEYNDDSLLGVIAAGTMLDDLKFDLTPNEIRSQRAIEEKGRQIIFLGIYGLVILVLICAIFFSKIYFRSLYFEKLKADYTQKQKNVEILDHISQNTQIIKDFTVDRLISLDVIKTLYALIPDEMYLQSINLEETGAISIQGTSESMARVFDFNTALVGSPLFKNVKIKSTASKQERGKEMATFEITLLLASAPDEEQQESEEPTAKTGDKDQKDQKDEKGEKKPGKEKKEEKAAKAKEPKEKS
jgi:Tfp pilus assembly PilM family ATPase/Tfp pilus assembly protein PilN